MPAFWEGVIAGYGIAVPVGAIAVLIIDTSLRGGFWPGFMAGAGAATGDLLYAALAAVAGGIIAAALEPYSLVLRFVSAFVLLALGGYGLRRARQSHRSGNPKKIAIRGGSRTYVQFLGLTFVNPMTVAYFGALILGGSVETLGTVSGRILFVIGAGISSLSWQTFLAGGGAFANRYLSPRFQAAVSVIGNLVVIALGIRILVQLLFS